MPPKTANSRLAAIDAIRGYAVLLVIIVHTGGAMPELPYPLKKLTNFGWYGVQLFFIASAVTLLMSWARGSNRTLGMRLSEFFKRRFLRIAPMYYSAALLYFYLRPPGEQFSLWQLAVNLGFLNAWHPDWMPVTGTWQVVPGGWSIGVEFSFYLVFPWLALLVINLQRALYLIVFSLVIMLSAHPASLLLFPWISGEASNNFAYYWLPNQFVIFALGFLAYSVIAAEGGCLRSVRECLGKHVFSVIGMVAVLVLALAEAELGPHKFVSATFPWVPTHLLVGLLFSFGVVALIENPTRFFVFPWIRQLGQYSFSAYCLHFGIIGLVYQLSHGAIDKNAQGIPAIGYFSIYLGLVLLATYFSSKLTFHLIETPFIRMGHRPRKSPE